MYIYVPKFIKMTFKSFQGETLYSCTVITTEANSSCKYVHSRVPLLLNDDNTIEVCLIGI